MVTLFRIYPKRPGSLTARLMVEISTLKNPEVRDRILTYGLFNGKYVLFHLATDLLMYEIRRFSNNTGLILIRLSQILFAVTAFRESVKINEIDNKNTNSENRYSCKDKKNAVSGQS